MVTAILTLRPVLKSRHLQGQAAWCVAWVLCTAAGVFMRPSPVGHATHTQLGLPPCPSMLLFHRPCPGCGLTTSWTYLLHGDLAASFHAHPFGPLLYLLFTVGTGFAAYGLFTKRWVDTNTKPMNWFLVCLMVAFLGFGFWRFAHSSYSLLDADYSMRLF